MWIQLIRYIRKGLSNTVFLFNSWYLDTETCMRKLSYCSFCIYGGRCVLTSIWSLFITQRKEQEEAMDNLKLLEEKLKGNKFFGGEMIRFLDLALGWLASLISVMEEIIGLKVVDEKFPFLSAWKQNFANALIIRDNWSP
ncbi:hypothetical protein PVL29_019477 [Vitis rotundifolia]|uniref:Glutathione S-transferase C-terminal domain-containing protein n=1 Tax=Vitis rotundifolia TaxID=103349 RepID=A0AA38Z1D9_VITRO|nr:hypothetical protein PVL29_019477 [Vitis rotundifolia]